MSIDRADWHYGGDYPKELPVHNAATHIGMYLTWIVFNGLEADQFGRESGVALHKLRSRKITGGQLLTDEFDGKFFPAMLSDHGLAFTQAYYQGDGDESYGQYLMDYVNLTDDPDVPTVYHVADSWENYDRLAPLIDVSYAAWASTGKLKTLRILDPDRGAPIAQADPTEHVKLSKDAWYSRRTWTDHDKREFDARLKRSRTASKRKYYLTSQATTLRAAGQYRAAVELYDRTLSENPDLREEASAHGGRARSLVKLGLIDEAVAAFRQSLKAERAVQRFRTDAGEEFGWLIIERQWVQCYPDLRELVGESRSWYPFEISCARALLAESDGNLEEAAAMARDAIKCYSDEQIESREYRGRLRLLDLRYRSLESRLKSLAALLLG